MFEDYYKQDFPDQEKINTFKLLNNLKSFRLQNDKQEARKELLLWFDGDYVLLKGIIKCYKRCRQNDMSHLDTIRAVFLSRYVKSIFASILMAIIVVGGVVVLFSIILYIGMRLG